MQRKLVQKIPLRVTLEIGILSGLLTLSIAAGAFCGGRLGDRFGRRNVFIITMAMILIGSLALAFGQTFLLLLLGTLFVGLATGADLPVSLATISEAANDQNRGKIIGLSNLLWLVGIGATMGISAVVGDWGRIGAQIMYLHVGLVALVLLVLRWSIPESPLWLAARDELRRGVATVRAQKTGWRDLLEGKYLWPFLSLCAFYTFTNLAANTGGQFGTFVAVNVVGISVSTNSLWGLMILPVSVISGLLFMRIVDTSKRLPFFIFGAVMMSGGYLVPVLLNFSPLSWFCCLLFTNIGTGFAFEGIMKVWAQESFPTMLRATAQGVIVGVARLTCGLLAFVTPGILSAGPVVLYCLLTAIVVLGMVIGWLCFHGKQRNEFNAETEIVASPDMGHLSQDTARAKA